MARTTIPKIKLDLNNLVEIDSGSLTTRQLRDAIRLETTEANRRIKEYQAAGHESAIMDSHVNALKLLGGTSGPDIGLGLTYKSKAALKAQFDALRRFNTKEQYSYTAQTEADLRADKAYKTFVEKYGEISKSDWTAFVEMTHSLHEILHGFNYEAVYGAYAAIFADADEYGKRHFMDIVNQEVRAAYGKNISPYKLAQNVADRIEKVRRG